MLPDYIEEKTSGAVRAAEVQAIPLALLRHPAFETPTGRSSRRSRRVGITPGLLLAQRKLEPPHVGCYNGTALVGQQTLDSFLQSLSHQTYLVVNAESYADLNCFAGAVLRQVAAGKRFVFQSAGSLVKALSGIPDKLLFGKEIVRGTCPGLFIAGSYVGRTTAQLNRLLKSNAVEGIEISVEAILKSAGIRDEALPDRLEMIWRAGRTPVVFTSRCEREFDSKDERLSAGNTVSRFLARLVRDLPFRPSYLVGKGGITSHDILVHGLRVSQARVLGQILSGVPVIMTPEGSALPQMPYIIFPGNVGDEDALLRVFEILK